MIRLAPLVYCFVLYVQRAIRLFFTVAFGVISGHLDSREQLNDVGTDLDVQISLTIHGTIPIKRYKEFFSIPSGDVIKKRQKERNLKGNIKRGQVSIAQDIFTTGLPKFPVHVIQQWTRSDTQNKSNMYGALL